MSNANPAKKPPTPQRRGPTPQEIIQQQKEQAERERAARAAAKSTGTTVVKQQQTPVAVPDNRTAVQQYLDEVAPASIVGRMIKFGKDGNFITADDGEPIPDTADFVALCDQTLVGWIKFNGEGEPPDRIMGLLYDGFRMPPNESLPDRDMPLWEPDLSGLPADPWQHHQYLVLQNTATQELFTFVTASKTGRRAVGNLLRHYDRMQKTTPNELPVVRLKAGGFNHRDERIGWVATPVFAVVGRSPRDSVVKPDTSLAADMDDDIPI